MPKPKIKQLNPRHELFCQLYVKNSELFGNATQCYAEAYNYKLGELSDERPMDEKGKEIGKSERELAENTCAVEGARILRSPQVQERVTKLLNEMLKDDIVDRELAKIILQNHEFPTKMAAIREYNKVRQRIVEKVDVTSKGAPIKGINYIVPKDGGDHS